MWINKSGAKLQQYNENQRVLFVKHIDNYIILTNRMSVVHFIGTGSV